MSLHKLCFGNWGPVGVQFLVNPSLPFGRKAKGEAICLWLVIFKPISLAFVFSFLILIRLFFFFKHLQAHVLSVRNLFFLLSMS